MCPWKRKAPYVCNSSVINTLSYRYTWEYRGEATYVHLPHILLIYYTPAPYTSPIYINYVRKVINIAKGEFNVDLEDRFLAQASSSITAVTHHPLMSCQGWSLFLRSKKTWCYKNHPPQVYLRNAELSKYI